MRLLRFGLPILAGLLSACMGSNPEESVSFSSNNTPASSQHSIQSSSSKHSAQENIQLLSGKSLYDKGCAHCHNSDGREGGFGPALNNWQGTALELVNSIETTMPPGKPIDCDFVCANTVAAYILAGFTAYGTVHPDIIIEDEQTPILPTLNGLNALNDTTATLVHPGRANASTSTLAPWPLRIEAEHFDSGGENISYWDQSETKEGDLDQRPNTPVDIQATNDIEIDGSNGDFNIAWAEAGEWLKYSFYLSQTQRIRLSARIASPYPAMEFTWQINGQPQGTVLLAGTGEWQNYANAIGDSELLDAGWHTLRIEMVQPFNFNYLMLSRSPIQPLDISTLPAHPGTLPPYRLSNLEYQKTVYALFGIAINSQDLIADDVSENFTRMNNILRFNGLRLGQYYTVAEHLLDALFNNPENKTRLMRCTITADTQDTCIATLVNYWGNQLWRGPLSTIEIAKANDFINLQIMQGNNPEDSFRQWLHAMLVSAKFLHHIEIDSDISNDQVHPLSSVELSNRLAYFLWCSPPDTTLRNLTQQNPTLSQNQILEQLDRMLADEKANCLGEGFASEWLYLNAVAQKAQALTVDNPANWQPALADSMVQETQHFVMHLIRNNRPIGELLGASYTFADDTLADYYQLPRATSADKRIDLTGTQRQGLLTQGAVLLLTGSSRGTAFIKRGIYTLDNLLCDAPPAPPPNIDQSADTNSDACQGCHRYINPIGNGLGHFDSFGLYQPFDAQGNNIIASGNFFNGPSFEGAKGMIDLLKDDERLAACGLEKFYSYAHARHPSHDDEVFLAALNTRWQEQELGLRDLLALIVTNPTFTHRHAPIQLESADAH